MLDDFLKEVILITVGKGNEEIATLLNSNKYQNEFIIAKKLGITINQTRNILYKISDNGLVLSERKKDKKKGWYTYYWKFNVFKCLDFLKKRMLDMKEKFEQQIEMREKNQFYMCEFCNTEYSLEAAMNMNFSCDECGELLVLKNDEVLIKSLKKNVEKLNLQLEEIEIEVEKEIKKMDRKKEKGLKLEEEEKEKKKLEAKQRRDLKKKEADKEKQKNKEMNLKIKKEVIPKKIKGTKKIISLKKPKKENVKKELKKKKVSGGPVKKKKIVVKKVPLKKKILSKIKKDKKKVIKKTSKK